MYKSIDNSSVVYKKIYIVKKYKNTNISQGYFVYESLKNVQKYIHKICAKQTLIPTSTLRISNQLGLTSGFSNGVECKISEGLIKHF